MILSIIIPAFNAEAFIGRCLESIISQSFSDIEIIVIDDGSSDSTLAICQDYSRIDNRIVVLSHPNQGVSVARNHGLRFANGEYVWFVDADDYIEPNKIDFLLNITQKYNLDLLQFGFNIVSSNNNITRGLTIRESNLLPFSTYLERGYFKAVLWQSFIRRSCIGNVVFRDNIKLWEDGLFFITIFKNINLAKRIETKVYNYYQNDSSVTHNIPFDVCLKVADEISTISIPNFAHRYVNEFIAFYASLSIYSNGYNQQILLEYIANQSPRVRDLFFRKFIQNQFAYNYGLLKERKSKDLRVNTLKKIKLINSKTLKSSDKFIKVLRMSFKILPLYILDLLFYISSPLVKFLFLKR